MSVEVFYPPPPPAGRDYRPAPNLINDLHMIITGWNIDTDEKIGKILTETLMIYIPGVMKVLSATPLTFVIKQHAELLYKHLTKKLLESYQSSLLESYIFPKDSKSMSPLEHAEWMTKFVIDNKPISPLEHAEWMRKISEKIGEMSLLTINNKEKDEELWNLLVAEFRAMVAIIAVSEEVGGEKGGKLDPVAEKKKGISDMLEKIGMGKNNWLAHYSGQHINNLAEFVEEAALTEDSNTTKKLYTLKTVLSVRYYVFQRLCNYYVTLGQEESEEEEHTEEELTKEEKEHAEEELTKEELTEEEKEHAEEELTKKLTKEKKRIKKKLEGDIIKMLQPKLWVLAIELKDALDKEKGRQFVHNNTITKADFLLDILAEYCDRAELRKHVEETNSDINGEITDWLAAGEGRVEKKKLAAQVYNANIQKKYEKDRHQAHADATQETKIDYSKTDFNRESTAALNDMRHQNRINKANVIMQNKQSPADLSPAELSPTEPPPADLSPAAPPAADLSPAISQPAPDLSRPPETIQSPSADQDLMLIPGADTDDTSLVKKQLMAMRRGDEKGPTRHWGWLWGPTQTARTPGPTRHWGSSSSGGSAAEPATGRRLVQGTKRKGTKHKRSGCLRDKGTKHKRSGCLRDKGTKHKGTKRKGTKRKGTKRKGTKRKGTKHKRTKRKGIKRSGRKRKRTLSRVV